MTSQLESIVQTALGDDDDEGPKIAFDISSKDRTQIGEYSSSHVMSPSGNRARTKVGAAERSSDIELEVGQRVVIGSGVRI